MKNDKVTRDLVYKLCEVGWLYKQIDAFQQETVVFPTSTDAHEQVVAAGLIRQGLSASIGAELQSFHKFVAILKSQLKNTSEQSKLTLKRLYVWINEPLQSLRILNVVLESCKNSSGGELLSNLHAYTTHGDPRVSNLVVKLVKESSMPIYSMIQRWITQGELDDPHAEFFVQKGSRDPKNVWKNEYILCKKNIPVFINDQLAQKVYLVGKSLHFMRYHCNIGTENLMNLPTPESIDSDVRMTNVGKQMGYGDLKPLETAIHRAYISISRALSSSLLKTHSLMRHLETLKRFLLLSQGDFLSSLLDSSRFLLLTQRHTGCQPQPSVQTLAPLDARSICAHGMRPHRRCAIRTRSPRHPPRRGHAGRNRLGHFHYSLQYYPANRNSNRQLDNANVPTRVQTPLENQASAAHANESVYSIETKDGNDKY